MTFENLSELILLDLYNNNLSKFQVKSIQDKKQLQELCSISNELSDIDDEQILEQNPGHSNLNLHVPGFFNIIKTFIQWKFISMLL